MLIFQGNLAKKTRRGARDSRAERENFDLGPLTARSALSLYLALNPNRGEAHLGKIRWEHPVFGQLIDEQRWGGAGARPEMNQQGSAVGLPTRTRVMHLVNRTENGR